MHPEPLQQIGQVRATAHSAMLAGIRPLSRFVIHKRRGAAAEHGPLLEKHNAEAVVRQRGRRRDSRDAAADNGY